MLTTNLSTRPFYNERSVRALLLAALLAILALTVFNVWWALSLRGEEQRLSARATEARARAGQLREEARGMTAQIDPRQMEAVANAASEANDVIAQRAFSWTALLADLEATLPDNVRVTSVQPRAERGVIRVALNVEAATPEALALFMDALEERGTFSNVLPRGQVTSEEGLEAGIEATYTAPPADAAAAKTASTRTRRDTGGAS
jgi:Tfp pilus assembly protein PilN